MITVIALTLFALAHLGPLAWAAIAEWRKVK